MELLKRIAQRHGYILEDEMKELYKIGRFMKVVVKTYCGERAKLL